MKNEDKDLSRIRAGEAAPERPVHANPSTGSASTPATKGYRAIACPGCDYTTGIMQWSPYGEQNARGALVSHLVRKKHGMSRALAKEAARTAAIVPLDDKFKRITGEVSAEILSSERSTSDRPRDNESSSLALSTLRTSLRALSDQWKTRANHWPSPDFRRATDELDALIGDIPQERK